jgi:hypothetical protein
VNVLYGTAFLQAIEQPLMMKKSLPESPAEALLSRVMKEMKRPRKAHSGRVSETRQAKKAQTKRTGRFNG